MNQACVEEIRRSVFSSFSPTFSVGAVARWRSVFDEGLRDAFKDVAGDELVRYGYELSLDW